MANIIEISNLDLPQLALFTKLTQAQLRSQAEAKQGVFIAESPKVIDVALNSGCQPLSFLMERKHIDGQAKHILDQFPDVPVYTGDRNVLAELTGYELTRGILCAMTRPKPLDPWELCKNAKRVAILEGIVDSTNVGAIFRSAAALNVDAVLVTPTCCDPLCRRSIRVSMGTVFLVPWAQIGDRKDAWPHPCLENLQKMGFKTAAMALTDQSVSIEDPTLSAEPRLAIIMGTEGNGLSQDTINSSDYTVKIPMSHQVDSLNVAAASAVAFWELRSRSAGI